MRFEITHALVAYHLSVWMRGRAAAIGVVAF